MRTLCSPTRRAQRADSASTNCWNSSGDLLSVMGTKLFTKARKGDESRPDLYQSPLQGQKVELQERDLAFELPPGSFATVLVAELLGTAPAEGPA